LLKLTGVALSVLLLSALGFLTNYADAQTQTNYLLYQNNQYGFSIKYPSNWEKSETITKSSVFPNMLDIVTFSTSSELTNYGVSLIENDATYKGLSGQKFLDKMKDFERSVECSYAEEGETCSMEVKLEQSVTQNGYLLYFGIYQFTFSDNQDSYQYVLFVTMAPNGNDVWELSLYTDPDEDYQGIGEEAGNMFDTFTIYDYKGEQKQLLLQSKAAQKDDIVYLVIKNPTDSSNGIYSIKLTTTNGKITNFIKIKDWNYVRLGSDSVIYQTTSLPLGPSDVIKIILKVDSKNTEIQWEAFSKDQKSLGIGKVKTS